MSTNTSCASPIVLSHCGIPTPPQPKPLKTLTATDEVFALATGLEISPLVFVMLVVSYELRNGLVHGSVPLSLFPGERWNAKVTDADDVYVLCDFAFRCGESVYEIARSLKGRKHLILGNHDPAWLGAEPRAAAEFVEIALMLEIELDGRRLTLCHYPMMSWRDSDQDFSWLIFGHVHNNTKDPAWPLLRRMPRALNAGVDVNRLSPVAFDGLVENSRMWKRRDPKGWLFRRLQMRQRDSPFAASGVL